MVDHIGMDDGSKSGWHSEDKSLVSNSWRVDDLDVGLVAGLSNLHGLGHNELDTNDLHAYDMTQVLSLPMFKEEIMSNDELLQALRQHSSIPDPSLVLHSSILGNSISRPDDSVSKFDPDDFMMSQTVGIADEKSVELYTVVLSAPTAPGRRLDEETLTWLNQGQSYELILQKLEGQSSKCKGGLVKSVVSIGFCQRKYQYFETEKYDEWVQNRPNDRMIELDIPMCLGILSPQQIGSYTNEIEFRWDTDVPETRLFVKVNCLSSEFTKGKSGESGIPLRLQLDIYNSPDASHEMDDPAYSCGCQIKVFRAKGANRKLKVEKEKHDSLSKEIAGQMQPSYDVTVLRELKAVERLRHLQSSLRRKLSGVDLSWGTPDSRWVSPTSSQLQQLTIASNSSPSLTISPAPSCNPPHTTTQSSTGCENLTANSTVDETQAWLAYHRFSNFSSLLANFTGADLLRLSRSDLIQLCGPADGIRLNNALQSRASRPLLTMYVSPEWHQSSTGMREYHAMFLESLTVEDLKKKLAKKCGIEEGKISALYKLGPTGIHIFVDDEMVRNFVDEAHHVVEVLKDPLSDVCRRILLK